MDVLNSIQKLYIIYIRKCEYSPNKNMKLRAAIIVDNLFFAKWQKEALDKALKEIDIVMVLNCENTIIERNYIKHFLYYLVRFLIKRNEFNKIIKIPFFTNNIINFKSKYEGIWQILPKDINEKLKSEKVDIVIKFGMNLLKINNDLASIAFLSYHHGNPSKYRGRPVGFYEILNNEDKCGVVVQKLNNVIDGGEVLAFAECKTIKYSYNKTVLNIYKSSKFLLLKAVINFKKGNQINFQKVGKSYTLPSNLLVFKIFVTTITNALNRIFYGLFIEKKWRVAMINKSFSLEKPNIIQSSQLIRIPINNQYHFYADPFFSLNKNFLRLEALSKKNCLGEILEIQIDSPYNIKKIKSGRHFSYPINFSYQGVEYLLPEVASHSPQYFYQANDSKHKKYFIKGLEKKRIVDATFYLKDKIWYLFFTNSAYPNDTPLNLWYSDSPFGKFQPHQSSPLIISPDASRMGGRIFKLSDRIIRFGQNNSKEYGKDLSLMEITKLSITEYEEKFLGKLSIDNFNGPHTLDYDPKSNIILIDYYNNEFSLFAGINRIISRFNKYN